MIHRTECVSFPRSGHHLLVRLLTRYFGEDLAYCEMYKDPDRVLDLDPTTNFQKNHDLDLDTLVQSDRRYIVQVRFPVDSLVSWFKASVTGGHMADDPNAWQQFAVTRTVFWMRFYRKWVMDPLPNRLVLDYDRLVADPESMLGHAVEFLTDDFADRDRLIDACAGEEITRRHNVEGFRYYGAQFFGMLRGFYAAVPGVDLDTGRLSIDPVPDSDSLAVRTEPVLRDLLTAGREVQEMAMRLQRVMATEAADKVGVL